MKKLLKDAYDKSIIFANQGKVADYIPELAKEDPLKASIAIIDKEGNMNSYGAIEQKFSVQSILKVVFYLMLLEEYDTKIINKTIGVKPTALPFNSILDVELANGKPRNPYVNSGAMATVALLYERFKEKTESKILEKARLLMGNNDLKHSEEIFQSEIETAFNNIAILNLMVGRGILPTTTPRQKVLNIYTRTCALMVDVKDLVRLSSVISNDGYDILDNQRKFKDEHGRYLRTLMATSGMYNYSGEFALNVGLPAKSGVGGGIITASNKGYGVATYCPGLDESGNSLVGTKILEYISKELALSIY